MSFASRDAPLAGSNALSNGGRSTGQQLQALYVKICKPLSICCLCSQTSGFASRKRVHPTYGVSILTASGIGSTTVFDEIASKSCQCGIQVAAAVLRFRGMTPTRSCTGRAQARARERHVRRQQGGRDDYRKNPRHNIARYRDTQAGAEVRFRRKGPGVGGAVKERLFRRRKAFW